MRVTLKVEYKQQAVRHNIFYLYNILIALIKWYGTVLKRFALGTANLATAFATLISLLKVFFFEYRLELMELLAKERDPVKQLSEAERKEQRVSRSSRRYCKEPMN